MATANIKTRVQRLEENTGGDMSNIFIRAYHQIPPDSHQARGVLRFLTSEKGCTIEDTHAFLAWFDANQAAINTYLSRIAPGWETQPDNDDAAVTELANMLHEGGVGVDELFSLFPDLAPKVMARRDVYLYEHGQGDDITVKLF